MIKKQFILYLFLLSSILLLLDIFLYWSYKISFAGFYTDCVVFWVWILSFLGCIIVYWKKLMAKISLGVFVLGIVVNIFESLPLMKAIEETTKVRVYWNKKLNNQYRIESSGEEEAMEYIVFYIIENKYFLFEKELGDCIYEYPKHYYKNINLILDDKDSLHLKIENEDTSEIVKISKN